MNPRLAVWLVNGLLGALAASTLFPLLWMLSASFMAPGASTSLPTPILPPSLTLENYRTLFGTVGMGRYLLNSLLIATLATAISVTFNLMAGYAFAKLRFRGRDAIFRLLLGALVIPGQVAMLPLFLMLKPLGLINTYGGAIVPAMASVFGIFLVRQFARGIPDELLEAARIDGAGELRIFTTVVVPLLKPIVATLAVFSFLAAWNDFMWPLIVLTDDCPAHASGRACRPVARARAGQRADDGRLGDHGAAGAAALSRLAAPVHGRPARRQRQGMKALLPALATVMAT